MPQWLLSTSMLSEVAEFFSMQPCQAQMPSVRLKIPVAAPGGDACGRAEARGGLPRRRLGTASAEPGVFLIGLASACHLIDAPGIGGLRMTCERTAERDYGAHAVGQHFRE